jgi:hypothetical protein
MMDERLIVIEHMTDSIIIAGHSHVVALIGSLHEEGDPHLFPLEEQDRIFGLRGPWPRTENYWSALTRYAPGNSIALLWDGNQHNGYFLIEQPLRFDFVPRRLQSLPVEEDAVIVPETLVRAKFFQSLLGSRTGGLILNNLLTDLRAQTHSRIALVGTPPPKGDNERLLSFLPSEFAYLHNPAGLTVEQVRLTPPTIRLKLWNVIQEIYQEQAERVGVEFIPVPDIVTDEAGFLKPEFWTLDVTHANAAYGRVMLNHLVQKLRGG